MIGFSNLAKSIEILEKDHKQLKIEVTNLKQMKIEESHAEGNQNHSKRRHISPYERNKENILNNGSSILDEILKRQRPANDRTGLGYRMNKRSDRWISKSKFEEDISSPKDHVEDQIHFIKWKREGQVQEHDQPRSLTYQNKDCQGGTFKGHCYTCHKYGHKFVNCKEKVNMKNSNPHIKCWRYNLVGHPTKSCHTLKCFKCKGFGHKATDCRSTSSTYEQNKSTLKSFEETNFLNTSKRKMKEVWRLKKIPSCYLLK